MSAFLLKWFTGPRFWNMLATIEVTLLLVQIFFPFMNEVRVMQNIIVMWIALATAEILTVLNANKSDNP